MAIAGILVTVQAHNAANHNGDSRISNVLLPYDAVQHPPPPLPVQGRNLVS